MIQHKWIDKQRLDDKDFDESATCSVCGCKRHHSRYWGFYMYERNQINFINRPECYSFEPDFQHAMGEFN